MLRAKYLKGLSFFQHVMKPEASFVWKCIIKAREWLQKRACVKIGNGHSTNVWHDPWVPDLVGAVPKACRGSIRMVADLRDREVGSWNESLIKSLFIEEEENLILASPWSSNLGEDKLLWCGKNSERFSIKSSYLMNFNNLEEEVSMLWGKLWKLKIHDRMKLFLWRVMVDAIPTRVRMARRTRVGEVCCPICGAEEETLFHLFKE